MSRPTPNDVLSFWFTAPDQWWTKDPTFDALVRDRFRELHEAIMRGDHPEWLATARGSLAYVIVLDQFSRNMFRDTARMFDSDPRALEVAKQALAAHFDQDFTADEKMFLYMPFMHSEEIDDQDRCVALFESAGLKDIGFAEKHRDIVRRFGRFPHRNEMLGRESTPEEVELLKQPGSSF